MYPDLNEVMRRFEERRKTWTEADRLQFLQKAKILDENGDFDERFFDPEINRRNREYQAKLKQEKEDKE